MPNLDDRVRVSKAYGRSLVQSSWLLVFGRSFGLATVLLFVTGGISNCTGVLQGKAPLVVFGEWMSGKAVWMAAGTALLFLASIATGLYALNLREDK